MVLGRSAIPLFLRHGKDGNENLALCLCMYAEEYLCSLRCYRRRDLLNDDRICIVLSNAGRVLILEGIEKAERNVLPVLNNLLENRWVSSFLRASLDAF